MHDGEIDLAYQNLAEGLTTMFAPPPGQAMRSSLAQELLTAMSSLGLNSAAGSSTDLVPPPVLQPSSASDATSESSEDRRSSSVFSAPWRRTTVVTEAAPKATTKAAAKAASRRRSASTGSSDSSTASLKRQRGRPSANRKTVLIECLLEYADSSADEKCFASVNTFRRRLERYLTEFTDLMIDPAEFKKLQDAFQQATEKGETVDMEEKYPIDDEHVIIKKRAQEALNVSRQWCNILSFDHEFKQVYRAACTFLQTPPRAPYPFPAWLLQRSVAVNIEDAGGTSDCPFSYQPPSAFSSAQWHWHLGQAVVTEIPVVETWKVDKAMSGRTVIECPPY